MQKKIRFFAVLSVILLLAGCVQKTAFSSASVQSAETQQSASSPVISDDINVRELWEKYDADPDKNKPTYDGEEETATGIIVYIGKDDHGTDSMELSDQKDGTSYVLGVFGSAEEMASASVGDTVTITGKFHIMSSTNMVVLKQCRILEIH